MNRYVLIETRSPIGTSDVGRYYELALGLAEQGHDVTLFLTQNAVLATRKAIPENPLARLLDSKVTVLADAFSLRERAVTEEERAPAVKAIEMDELVDRMMAVEGTQVMWH